MESTRDAIKALIDEYPGLHMRELARQADLSLHLVQYHLERLEAQGAVELRIIGGKVRVYRPGIDAAERNALAVIRDAKRLRIVSCLLEQGEATHQQVATALRMGKSTLSFHLKNLVEADIVAHQGNAYSIKAPDAMRLVMAKYKPVPGPVDRMAKLWGKMHDRSHRA